ncbi:VOC family protein [Mesorhizobium sp. IMUNJ 23033]|uniref:SMU1112c/YaeR family gloxylase I-like metalloprotein n=1 Tax=Mesorhizobium sp. IMUNJ 23033 TaxID=3378039 RepID=UPI00384B4D87
MFCRIHHVAIICSDYLVSKRFYVEQLGFGVVDENWRADRQSWKCDLECGEVRLELFSFPTSPPRPSRPEARGLRHLAFAVESVAHAVEHLQSQGISIEPVRIDPYTGALFTFFADPDGLPIEIYQVEPSEAHNS